jgi:hypothetical protein
MNLSATQLVGADFNFVGLYWNGHSGLLIPYTLGTILRLNFVVHDLPGIRQLVSQLNQVRTNSLHRIKGGKQREHKEGRTKRH